MSRLICFSLLLTFCSGCGRSTSNKASGTSTTSTEIAVAAAPVVSNANSSVIAERTTIDASVLLKGADLIVPLKDLGTKDEFALAEQFGRKTVQTTGTIDDISFDSPTTSLVTFKQGLGYTDLLKCKILEASVWTRLVPGQTITLHGTTGKGRIAEEFGWKVVEAEPNTAPLIPIQQFVQDFDQNMAAAKVKYANRPFYLTAEFAGLEPGDFGAMNVRLKKQGQWTVKLALKHGSEVFVQPLPLGQKLAALCLGYSLGDYLGGADETNHLIMFHALPIVQTFPFPGVNYPADFPSKERATADLIKQIRETSADYENDASGFYQDFAPKLIPGYSDKLVQVTGTIKSFDYASKGAQLELRGPEEFSGIKCDLLESSPWDVYEPGQKIVLKGKLPRFTGIPSLEQAVVVNAEPPENPLREMSAADLLKATRVADADGTFDKEWKDKYVRIFGTLAESSFKDYGASLKIQGDDATEVTINLTSGDQAQLLNVHKLKAGDTIRLLAKIDYLIPGSLSMSKGWVLSDKPSKQ